MRKKAVSMSVNQSVRSRWGTLTCAEYRQSSEIVLVLCSLDSLVDQRSCLPDDKQDEEHESKLMYHMLIHVAVVKSLNSDRTDQGEGHIARIFFRLSES